TRFFISKPIKDLPDYKPGPGTERQEAEDKMRRNYQPPSTGLSLENDYTDPVRQTNIGLTQNGGAPLVDFEGTADSIWNPPDPNGAVSADYYVQLVNVTFTVFDKKGNVVVPAKDLGSFWSNDPQDGDP